MNESASERAVATGAQTYEDYYGFAQAPFTLAPDPQFLYLSQSHDDALKRLLQAVATRKGFAVLSGEAGTGKTTIARALVARLDRASFGSLILNPFLSVEELVREVLLDFGVVSKDDVRSGRAAAASRDDLVRTLREFLAAVASIGGHGVLVLDEAQHLPPDVLDQVRLVARPDGEGVCPLQVVLIGQPSLLDLLAAPEMQPFDSRVTLRLRLESLSRQDTEAYVAHRLSVARSATAVYFDAEALDELHMLSGGVPRVTNLLCDRALMLCARERIHEVGVDAIRRAGRSLDLAPPAPAPRPRRRSWLAAGLASLLAIAVFLAFAPVADWIDTPLPDFPGAPHVTVAPAAEARPIPPTLEDAPAPPEPPVVVSPAL